MKEISDIILVDGIKYAKDHEWARPEGDTVKIGVTDYAQDQLGDIVFVELPEVDSELEKGDEFGTLESTKAVSELYMPIGGKVVAINDALEDDPERVNKDPYAGGWMIVVEPSDPSDMDALMDKDAYLEMLKGL
ncbi:glycine cleavage system protein H [Desulfonema ishimotonii]|uniref:Glycine cleavage system H protein n=1 Tax=Desulfonema ishimotonii TaxID=45657 RepID=A0A401G2F5_9BACT|nr:glycine cleavage system protein GcvH [Desulfonema ishimotonii]GBC63363.1 glycine cleavage system protein H [Desulfonema ishimotonii]